MVRSPNGPQAVQGGDPRPGHGVRVRSSPSRGVVDLEAELARDRLGPLHQAGGRLRLLHGRETGHGRDLDLGVGHDLKLGGHP